MPFFQGAYNFESRGGTFQGLRRRRRQQRDTNQPTSPVQSPPQTPVDPRLPAYAPSPITHSGSGDSEKATDEEAQTISDKSGFWRSLWMWLIEILCQIYVHALLRLPFHYQTRVERLSRDANMALKEILDLAYTAPAITNPDSLPPAYRNLTTRWGYFIDDLLEEWRTLNIVSALLVPGILTIFQVEGASNDPVTRYLAFWSLIAALISLLFCSAFIIQFSRMRKPSIAIEWSFEAHTPRTAFWSVGVMLSLPTVWLTWSIVAFIVSIMSYMWRCDANPPSDFPVPRSTELGFRIFVSAVLAIGTLYGLLIYISFRRYGPKMDEALNGRIDAYIASAASTSSLDARATSPESTPAPDFSALVNLQRQNPIRRQSRSRSPPSSRPPLAARSASLGHSSSSTPRQPSPLSNSSSGAQQV
ncbi:hypothetical protein NP233_g1756 [Leucocoprinus birnbaumii]|uniref:Uncharacterized protein n=1 Tax=Leucocoprinus birnbaumii TaxID=56174 RepID=A0AAD5W0B4_9AGAR|nr:hypothetical protein NP233_g1756 [Leucocoprinus birnbaumii]